MRNYSGFKCTGQVESFCGRFDVLSPSAWVPWLSLTVHRHAISGVRLADDSKLGVNGGLSL